MLGAFLLDMCKNTIDDNHHDDGNAQLRHPCDVSQGRRAPEHQREKMRQFAQEPSPLWNLPGRWQRVRPQRVQQLTGRAGTEALHVRSLGQGGLGCIAGGHHVSTSARLFEDRVLRASAVAVGPKDTGPGRCTGLVPVPEWDFQPYLRFPGGVRLALMENTEAAQETKELSIHDCWKYLQSTATCRIALVNGDAPEIFPVNYVPNFGTILFRIGQGTKLRALRESPVIAIEADGFNRYGTVAWSVILKGRPEFVTHPEEIQEAVDAGLSPWQAGRKDVLVRVTPSEISGRRFVIAPPAKWWPPVDPWAADVDAAGADDTTPAGEPQKEAHDGGIR